MAGGRKKAEGRSLKMSFSWCIPLNYTRCTQWRGWVRNKPVEGVQKNHPSWMVLGEGGWKKFSYPRGGSFSYNILPTPVVAMRQRILGSHTPPCHRRMVITTQFSVLPCCTTAQTSSVPPQVAFDCALAYIWVSSHPPPSHSAG